MKHLLSFFICTLLLGLPANAETPLSMQEAVDRYLADNLLLRSKNVELGKLDADIRAANQRPNPAFKAEIEAMRSGEPETESLTALSFPLVDKGFRKWSRHAAVHVRDAAGHQLTFETSLEIAGLKKTYVKLLYLRENLSSLNQILDSFAELERKNGARFRDGDIAEVELLKLASEKQKVARDLELVRLEYDLEMKALQLALVASEPFSLNGAFFRPFIPLEKGDWTFLACEHRRDLKAVEAHRAGLEASKRAAKREVRSPIDLDLGYKNTSSGFKGFVVGVSTPLSWSHGNQAKLQGLQAEAESGSLKREAIVRSLESTISSHIARMRFFQSRVEDLRKRLDELHEITRINAVAYEEGESTLLEMLDSFRAERELAMEKNQANLDYWSAAFDFEAAVGVPLPEKEPIR